jgi:hypothetical protein
VISRPVSNKNHSGARYVNHFSTRAHC